MNALTVFSGTLDIAAVPVTQDPLGGTLRFGGANSLPGFTTYDFAPASSVGYYWNGSQTVAAQNYGNLRSSSTGGWILAPAGIVGIAGAFTPGANAYTINGSTLSFNGAGAQTIPAFNYYNLVSSTTGPRLLASTNTMGIAASFTPGTNSYTTTGSTVDFNGAAQVISGFSYNNLSVSGSGTKTLGADAVGARWLGGKEFGDQGGDFSGPGQQVVRAQLIVATDAHAQFKRDGFG